jgi:hypothetical protein
MSLNRILYEIEISQIDENVEMVRGAPLVTSWIFISHLTLVRDKEFYKGLSFPYYLETRGKMFLEVIETSWVLTC